MQRRCSQRGSVVTGDMAVFAEARDAENAAEELLVGFEPEIGEEQVYGDTTSLNQRLAQLLVGSSVGTVSNNGWLGRTISL